MTVGVKDAALWLYDEGITPIWLPPNTKKACVQWGAIAREGCTRDNVADWFSDPDRNIAVLTGRPSGIVVVDVDTYAGGDPAPFAAHGAALVKSASGGLHFWYRYPGSHVPSKACPNPERKGVDVRGDGGYIVVPPSKVPSKVDGVVRPYVWEDWTLDLPAWELAEPLLFPKAAPQAEGPVLVADDPGWVREHLRSVPLGSQRQAITRLAGYLAGKGLPPDIAYAVIYKAVVGWPNRPSQPWTPADVEQCVQSIYAKEQGKIVAKVETMNAAAGLLPLTPYRDFMTAYEGKTADWLVEDWVPDCTVGSVTAPAGSHKTWLLLDLAVSVAMGAPFLGKYPVHRPGPVVVIQQEDPPALLAQRLGPLGISKQYIEKPYVEGTFLCTPKMPLFVCTGQDFSFEREESLLAMRSLVERVRPVLVILDPLYTMVKLDDFMAEAAQSVGVLKALRDEFGTSFMIAHHMKKKADEGGHLRFQHWGSALFDAALETLWSMKPEGTKTMIQRSFKVSGQLPARLFTIDIDLARVPCLELTEEELDEGKTIEEEQAETDVTKRAVLTWLQEHGATGKAELDHVCGGKKSAGLLLHELQRDGRIVRGKSRKYELSKIDSKEVTE